MTNPIGFFLHIPFPSPEIFAALPHHKQFARTFFAYDLVGFQTVRDRENFARYAVEHLGCRRLNDGRLKGFGRTLAIDAFPIGIDAEAFAAEAERNARAPELRSLARNADSQSLIVGVDRLDYTKGLPERIRGIEALLESWPAYRGRVQLLQIAPPTREGVEAYDAIRERAGAADRPRQRPLRRPLLVADPLRPPRRCRGRSSPGSSAAAASAW